MSYPSWGLNKIPWIKTRIKILLEVHQSNANWHYQQWHKCLWRPSWDKHHLQLFNIISNCHLVLWLRHFNLPIRAIFITSVVTYDIHYSEKLHTWIYSFYFRPSIPVYQVYNKQISPFNNVRHVYSIANLINHWNGWNFSKQFKNIRKIMAFHFLDCSFDVP